MIVENQPMGRAQEGVAVSPFPQDLHGQCLPEDHVMSHYVYALAGMSQFRVSKTLERHPHHVPWPWHRRLIFPVPKASPGYCCCPGSPESDLWARRWCRLWQPLFGLPVCGARDREREQGKQGSWCREPTSILPIPPPRSLLGNYSP